jgi:hypothetical protein
MAWISESGEELSRFGMTYTLRASGHTWLIVVAIIERPRRQRIVPRSS